MQHPLDIFPILHRLGAVKQAVLHSKTPGFEGEPVIVYFFNAAGTEVAHYFVDLYRSHGLIQIRRRWRLPPEECLSDGGLPAYDVAPINYSAETAQKTETGDFGVLSIIIQRLLDHGFAIGVRDLKPCRDADHIARAVIAADAEVVTLRTYREGEPSGAVSLHPGNPVEEVLTDYSTCLSPALDSLFD